MENKNANQQAFPVQRVVSGHGEDYWESPEKPGLTKREYFAGLAMSGLLANEEFYKISSSHIQPGDIAEFYSVVAVEQADALLKQLNP